MLIIARSSLDHRLVIAFFFEATRYARASAPA
jgi:hypothetical protein